MVNYEYKVWNEGVVCESWCYISINKGDRVIVKKGFVQPSTFDVIFLSTNKLIEKSLKKGVEIAKERILILKNNEVLNEQSNKKD